LKRTGIVYDRLFLEHKTGVHHVESPWRLESIWSTIKKTPAFDGLVDIPARKASLEDVEALHSAEHVEKILDTANEPVRHLDPDTITSEKSFAAAFMAVGAVQQAVKAVMAHKVDNAFALVRPPGHHAERNRPMGFCIFNNIALGAQYAQSRFGLKRILIVDWDVHHPNGTQSLFETSPEVLLFSTHRFPFFPGTGNFDACGSGAGLGFSLNVPLPAGIRDVDYMEIYHRLLVPVVREYQPELILVSAGFDAHLDDPIGGMSVTEKGFAAMAGTVLNLAEETCSGKTVLVLEGGYDLTALRRSVKSVLKTMLAPTANFDFRESPRSVVTDTLEQVIQCHKEYWRCLQHD